MISSSMCLSPGIEASRPHRGRIEASVEASVESSVKSSVEASRLTPCSVSVEASRLHRGYSVEACIEAHFEAHSVEAHHTLFASRYHNHPPRSYGIYLVMSSSLGSRKTI